MQQVDKTVAQNSWRGYIQTVGREAFDFELGVSVEREADLYDAKLYNLELMTQASTVDLAVTYCNRTGQPIGVNFVDDTSVEYSASIASQWLQTGPNALRDHVKNTPIAYTVYMVNKTLPTVQSVDDVNERVKMLASLYSVLAGGHGSVSDRANMINALQTCLWVNAKLGQVNVNHSYGAMFARNVSDLVKIMSLAVNPEVSDAARVAGTRSGMLIWIGNVLGRLVGHTMRDDLDWCEAKISAAISEVKLAVTHGKTTIDNGLTDPHAFSNLPQERKAKASGYAKNMKRKVETEAAANMLGDIF